MSARFIAHVERPDGRVHHIDCDAAHENDAGRLALTSDTYIGAVACYAPGAWVSYVLQAAPTPVTLEQVQRGEKSLNDYRRSLGMETIHCPTRMIPIPAPKISGNVCYLNGHAVCLPASITRINPDGTLDLRAFPGTNDEIEFTRVEFDITRQENGTWHWPHDADEPAGPAPEVPSPVTVNVTVQGSVISDRDLAQQIRKVINADWVRNRVSPSQMRH